MTIPSAFLTKDVSFPTKDISFPTKDISFPARDIFARKVGSFVSDQGYPVSD